MGVETERQPGEERMAPEVFLRLRRGRFTHKRIEGTQAKTGPNGDQVGMGWEYDTACGQRVTDTLATAQDRNVTCFECEDALGLPSDRHLVRIYSLRVGDEFTFSPRRGRFRITGTVPKGNRFVYEAIDLDAQTDIGEKPVVAMSNWFVYRLRKGEA